MNMLSMLKHVGIRKLKSGQSHEECKRQWWKVWDGGTMADHIGSFEQTQEHESWAQARK